MVSIINTKCLRIARTCSLYLSFFALGLCVAIPGPTLLDLQHAINTDTQHIGLIYSARSVGYLVGSLLGGIAFDMASRKQPLLIGCNLIICLSTLATPWCRSLIALVATMAISGTFMGALDTGGNVYCLNLWGKEGGPFYQALHFTFGLGGLVAPLVAAPFLDTQETADIDSGEHNETLLLVNSSNINGTHNGSSSSSTVPSITYAYTVIGCYNLLVTLFFLVLYAIDPKDYNANTEGDKGVKSPGLAFTSVVVMISSLLLAVYIGTEIGFQQMLTTYVVKSDMHLSKTTGSYMTSAFWASFSFGRGACIFLAIKLSGFTLMVCDLVVSLAAAVILLTLGPIYEWCLWFGTVLLGAGIASFFPSAITWIERYINMTSTIAALMVIGAAAGEMVIPLTISIFIEKIPVVLFYVVLTSIVASGLFTILLYFVLTRKGEKYNSE